MNKTVRPCEKVGCICTHLEPCEYGWIEVQHKLTKSFERNGEWIITDTWYNGAAFCPTCDPVRAHIQSSSTSSEELGQRLRQRSDFKVVENYDNQEASKTRTL